MTFLDAAGCSSDHYIPEVIKAPTLDEAGNYWSSCSTDSCSPCDKSNPSRQKTNKKKTCKQYDPCTQCKEENYKRLVINMIRQAGTK